MKGTQGKFKQTSCIALKILSCFISKARFFLHFFLDIDKYRRSKAYSIETTPYNST